ncbi:hypothetical protein [Undibacterium sp. Ren11W]|uniref:hypothetical protein n=1 Tax=Undibacterium sp. Ren11W TaxID=3413045 RepID=UPI003BF1E117
MKVIPSLEITSARLISSTVPDIGAGETAWVSGEVCAVNVERIRPSIGRAFSRIIAGGGAIAPEDDPVNWKDIGASNKKAMFDLYRNSQTSAASPLTVVLAPGKRVDSLALTGMTQVTSATIEVRVGATVVYTRVLNLDNRRTLSWSDYYFGEFSTKPSVILFDLPPFTGAQITVTLVSTTGTVKCGGCVIGTAVDIGDIEYGAEDEPLNFSLIERNKWGDANLVPRRSVPKTAQTLLAKKSHVNKIREVRNLLDAVPAIWAGLVDSDDGYFEMFLIAGVWKKFGINAQHPTKAKISLELEEI